MPCVLSIAADTPEYAYTQEETQAFVRSFFEGHFPSLGRMLDVFDNGQIERRYLSAPLEWFEKRPSFEERNNCYIETAVTLGSRLIQRCLTSADFLKNPIDIKSIDAIFFVSTTGLSTPSIDVRLINQLGFRPNVKRMPLWGLGCAGGTAGVARAAEYCRAYPEALVLLICIECCSLTFQSDNHTKSQFIGTSLFSDGGACLCIAGDQSRFLKENKRKTVLGLMESESFLLPDSEDVMGWDIKNNGLHVIFAKSIPGLVDTWLRDALNDWLNDRGKMLPDKIIAHPGGKKVLDALEHAFDLQPEQLLPSRTILKNYGNMSSPTVLFVLDKIMRESSDNATEGIMLSMGPGFCAEMMNVEWREAVG